GGLRADEFVRLLGRVARLVHGRQDDYVAGRAELRRLQERRVLGRQPGRVLHDVGGDLVVLERAVDFARLAQPEVAGDRGVEEEPEVRARVAGRLLRAL